MTQSPRFTEFSGQPTSHSKTETFDLLRFAKIMFGKEWRLTTLLVVLGSLVCMRLGIWQLDRLEQRRGFNAQVVSMRGMPVLDLNLGIPTDIDEMEWRRVQVVGNYDFEHQVGLRNQYYGDQYGYHLLSPLMLFSGQGVLVDRGWIPTDGNANIRDWRQYDEPGTVTLLGQIRLGSLKPTFAGVADPTLIPGQNWLSLWNNLDTARIAAQFPYPILNVYIQLDPNVNDTKPPIPYQPELELTEGSHFGYALQWFTFTALLFFGYPFYINKTRNREK